MTDLQYDEQEFPLPYVDPDSHGARARDFVGYLEYKRNQFHRAARDASVSFRSGRILFTDTLQFRLVDLNIWIFRK